MAVWERYLDHATTSVPKAPGVVERIASVLTEVGATPGRSSHRLARRSAELVERSRQRVAGYFGCDSPRRVLFSSGVTSSMNLALKGVLRPGDHVVATCFDHSAALRPLARLATTGVKVSVVRRPVPDSELAEAVIREFRPTTRMVVLNHASNAFGWLLPVEQIAMAAKALGVITLLDTAQTAGHIPIDMKRLGIDLLVFSGHKALLGPPGVGGLVIGDDSIPISPIIEGGTGFHSARLSADPVMMPISFEAGTPNTPAIAALADALDFVESAQCSAAQELASAAHRYCVKELCELPGVTVYAGHDRPSVPIISFTVRRIPAQRVAFVLDSRFDIQVRAGLHCAPLAHDVARTLPDGTVRASFGYGTTIGSAELLCTAVREIVRGKQ